jgi:hypothetical protein
MRLWAHSLEIEIAGRGRLGCLRNIYVGYRTDTPVANGYGFGSFQRDAILVSAIGNGNPMINRDL